MTTGPPTIAPGAVPSSDPDPEPDSAAVDSTTSGSRTGWASNRRLGLTMAIAVLVALVVAVRDRRVVLYDDAAITMRYAYRIAHGHGWTYNDGDRTNGASAPLFTMVLALCSRLGVNLETAAKAVGIAGYAACVGLVTFLAARLSTLVGGVIAAVVLLTCLDFRLESASGMESALAAALGLTALALVLSEHETWAGVVLGLCLVNKLDAGLLAAAIAIAYVLISRRPPWRIAVISAAVLAPWLVFSTAYFGSPLPYSMTQKLTVVGNPLSTFDHAWILDSLRTEEFMLAVALALAALGAVPLLARTSTPRAVALTACVGWALLHGVAFSLLDLGDPYPWYRTVLYPPVAVGAGVTLALVVRGARHPARPLAIAAVAAILVFAVGILDTGYGRLGTTVRVVLHGHQMDDYERFEATRREAGLYLRSAAAPGEVVATCWGWVAYGARQSPIQEACPLSTRKPVASPRWLIDQSFPGVTEPVVPKGGKVVASFVTGIGVGGRTTVIRLRR